MSNKTKRCEVCEFEIDEGNTYKLMGMEVCEQCMSISDQIKAHIEKD